MKTIVFLLDFYVGTALPTFHLGSSLQKRGYEVVYLGIPDIEPYVVKQGFTFHVIMEEVFPKGTRGRLKNSDSNIITKHFKYILAKNSVDRLLEQLEPTLLIANYFVSLEALVFWYKHCIPTTIFCSFLREPSLDPANVATGSLIRMGGEAFKLVTLAQQCGCSISNLLDLVHPIRQMPEIIGCPLEFDIPGVNRGRNVKYIEPCIRETVSRPHEFEWPLIKKETKLIYISLGSQVVSYLEKGKEYYRLFFEVMRRVRDRDWFFIFSFSSHINLSEFGPIPENVQVSHWVPQLEILKKASLSINHGGLGSIKECIYHGVPMLIFPLGADQFQNSKRVKSRNVGDIGKLDDVDMIGQIEELVNGGQKTEGLKELQKVFRNRQHQCCGASIIENIIASI